MTSVLNTWFSRDLRGELLAPIMDTQRTAGQIGEHPRLLLVPLLIAIPVAFVAASMTYLRLNYSVGALALYTHPIWSTSREFGALVGPLQGHVDLSHVSPGAGIVGASITLALVVMRSRFTWFPLHPLGFALAPTWAMMVFWFGFFVAWVIRSVVLRYGGLQTYRKLTPLMLGMIIGEFSSAVFWTVMNMAFKSSAPEFSWP